MTDEIDDRRGTGTTNVGDRDADTTPEPESADASVAADGGGLPDVPEAVDSAQGKLVYLAVATAGVGDVAALRRRLDMTRATLYAVLGTLESRGLVERVDGGFRAAGDA